MPVRTSAMPEHRQIDVRKQVRLSPAKSLRLCLNGIGHRLVRSGLTTAVVVLAVAFFMFMLSEGVFLQATSAGVAREIDTQREADRFLALVTDTPAVVVHRQRLTAVADDPEQLAMYARVAGTDPGRVEALARTCRRYRRYLRFFETLRQGQRVILVKKAKGRQIFTYLAGAEPWRSFADSLQGLKSLALPEPLDQFKSFVDGFTRFEAELAAFAEAWNQTVVELGRETEPLAGQTPVAQWLPTAMPAAQRSWQARVQARGFTLDDPKLARVVDALQLLKMRDDIARQLSTPEKRLHWSKLFREKPTLDQKMRHLDHRKAVAVLDGRYDRAELGRVSELVVRVHRLAELEQALAAVTDDEETGVLSGRQLFLLAISFVVCMVGIANAMLMAITERFREIATMKCLGATDGFILSQFMTEAGLQGLAGGALGVLIGFALASIKDGFAFGWYLLAYFPLLKLLLCGVVALLAGMALATLASLYPSWAASRMAPMEAMRVE